MTLLAFDFGRKRIGVAVGTLVYDPPLRQSRPLTTIDAEDNGTRFSEIARLISEWEPDCLIVGHPLSLDGIAHEMTARCERFANQLRGRFGLPVKLADERLSSVEAEARIREQGHGGEAASRGVDAFAAQIILEGFLDAQPH